LAEKKETPGKVEKGQISYRKDTVGNITEEGREGRRRDNSRGVI